MIKIGKPITKQSNLIYYIFGVIILSMVIIAMIVIIIRRGKEKVKTISDDFVEKVKYEHQMKDRVGKIRNLKPLSKEEARFEGFVKSYLQQGYSKKQIRISAHKNGWPRKVIRNVFRKVK